MKQSLFLIGILAFSASFFISAAAFSANNDIIINEIGASPTSTHEWIEIWNKGAEPVDLAGWKFWENNTSHSLAATTTDSLAAPGEYAAICQDSTAFIADHPAFGGSIFDSSWGSLNETGEEIGLKDAQENFLEQFTYQPATARSLERKNPLLSDYSLNNWQEHQTGDTLGFQNSNYAIAAEATSTASTASTTPASAATTPFSPSDSPANTAASSSPPLYPSTSSLWAQIKINEFLPDPENGEEWIELYNGATTSLDLVDGLLCDSREANCAIAATSGTIAAQGWATFFLNGSHLNNGGDSVILKNPDGTTVDQINYGTGALAAPEKGQTAARKNDGADTDADVDWAITTSLTPGSSNIIVEPPTPAPANNSGGGGSSNWSSGGGTPPAPSSAPSAPATIAKTTATTTTSTAKTPNKGATGDPVKIIWKISAPRAAAPQENVILSAVSSADPRGGAILMSWNLGDGAIIDGQTVSHAFSASGTYRVTVSATSTQGTTGQQTLFLSVAPGLSTHHGEVLISEVFPNPPGTDQGEFIELFNSAPTSISLAGWKLETSNEKSFTIPEKTIIKPSGNLVFYRAATRLVLDNTKEIITLKTPDNVAADLAAYSKSEPGQSLSLMNGERAWTKEITPGFIGVNEEPKEQVLGKKITADKIYPASPTTTPRPKPTTARLALADARALKKGSAVAVQGIVTVPPKTFSEHYFYIADSSGGLQMYSSKKDLPPLSVGDKVKVAGQLSQTNNVSRLKIASAGAIDILAAKQTLEPEKLALEDIDEDAAGKLIVVTGEITGITGNQLYLDDGETEEVVYLKTAAHIDRSRLKPGDTLQVTGVAEQTKNGWQIWPRGNDDLRLVAASAPSQTAGKNSNQTSKYAAVTIGGLALIAAAFIFRKRFPQL